MRHEEIEFSGHYKPIDCNLYDVLLAKATYKERVKIKLLKGGRKVEVESIIIDVFTKEGIEYLQTDNHALIRLDNIDAVGSIQF
jgi:transcriptional antiterminator Rof (Rho-off)